MDKSATLNLRVNPTLKSDAETQLHAKLQRGYDDYSAGRTQDAAAAFEQFRERHM